MSERVRQIDDTDGPGFATVEEAVEEIRAGRIVIVVDDADRENEGDLIMAAEKVTPESIAFIVRYSSGVICMPVLGERLDELEIPLMVAANTDLRGTAFTVSIDARRNITTGISAADRAATIRAIVDPDTSAGGSIRGPGTSSRCATARAGFSSGPATPRRRSTSPVWPACIRPVCCARP